jgi:hypothetical protein
MGSQKKEALEKYQALKDDYNFSYPLTTLRLVSFDLLPEGAEVTEEAIEDVMIRIWNTQEINDQLDSWYGTPVFVRACPLVPRPGVLESSRADTPDEARKIMERIATKMLSKDNSPKPMYDNGYIDPYGSIIIMPYIDADASAVASLGHYIMMGEGKDGITAGSEGLKMAIPLQQMDSCLVARELNNNGFDVSKLELEFVSKMNDFDMRSSSLSIDKYLVQLRGCEGARPIAVAPKGVSISGTFHGKGRIVVESIYHCADDSEEELERLEDALRDGMPFGTVVLHPCGNHLSHHAGQCMKYDVPYIASNDVSVGEQWTQATAGWVVLDPDGTYEPQPYDLTEYISDFKLGLNTQVGNYARQHGWLSNLFHQYTGGPINDPQQTAFFAGAFVGWLAKATLSVGMGETRHLTHRTNNATALTQTAIASIFQGHNIIRDGSHMTDDRKHYYADIESIPMSWDSVECLFNITLEAYRSKVKWSSSYGGAKYRDSLNKGLATVKAIKRFIKKPNADTLKELIAFANDNEHIVHNTGFFFSKFLSESALDWGTKPQHIQNLDPFKMFYAGLDVMNNMGKRHKTKAFDDRVRAVYEEFNTATLQSMRKTPLGERDSLLSEGMRYLHIHQRHPQGKYSDAYSDEFIRCGISACGKCDEHTTYLKQQLSSAIVSDVLPISSSPVFSFPIKLIGSAKHLDNLDMLLNKLRAWKAIHTSLDAEEKCEAIDEIKSLSTSIPKQMIAKNDVLLKYTAYFFTSLDADLILHYNKTKGVE